MEVLLDTGEVATILHIRPSRLARWRREGYGPAHIRVGAHVRYRPSDVQRWIDRQTRSTDVAGSEVIGGS